MVAIVSGNSLGLNLTSLATLGARGVAGNAAVGRGTDRAYVNVANGITAMTYDALGNLVSRTEAQGRPEQRTTRYAYDALGRQVRTDFPPVGVYGYDAVGNQTCVTDALGASTFTWYDALGTIRAVAAPARASAIDGGTLIPLTEFLRDAHGNVLMQTESANGAASVDEHGYTRAASADDRQTLNRYDSHGHLVQSQDALGIGHYRSYDARGNLVKSWQAVTAADGVTPRTLWQAWRFDALGRQTDALTPLDDGGFIDGGTQYNAFGEVIRQGTDGHWETHFDRDAAGHVWRTNDKDGIERIALYDLQGNATVEIVSDGSAPLTAASPLDALSASGIRRIDNRYDALGRLVDRLDTARDASPMQDNGEGGLTWASAAGTEHFAVRGANGDWIDIAIVHEDGESTADLSIFGPGDHAWRLEQTDAAGVSTTLTGQLHISPGQPARTVSANGVPGIPGVSAANGSIGGAPGSDDAAAWLVFPDPGKAYTAVFQYRAAGGDWITLPLVPRGDGKLGIDRRAIAAGHYAYQLLLSKPGDSAPPRVIAGTVDLPAYALTGRKVLAANADGSIRGAAPAKVLRWPLPPAGVTAQLYIRGTVADDSGASPWTTRDVQDDVLGVDASGQLSGYQKASLEGLFPGSYETDLLWLRDGQVIAETRGQLEIPAGRDDGLSSPDTAPSYRDAPSSYSPSYTIAAIPQRIDVASDQSMRPEIRQVVDRWGNVLAINDARSLAWVTSARYNADNQLIERIAPQVRLATGETVAPSTRVYYDALGRQVGTRDANGNLNRNLYDAGGQLAVELHADGGIVRYAYDAFGNAVRQVDANGNAIDHAYDKGDRLISTTYSATEVNTSEAFDVPEGSWFPELNTIHFDVHAAGMRRLSETLRYDEAGRRIAQANGNGETMQMHYDLRGNLVETIDALGYHTHMGYDISADGTGAAPYHSDGWYRYDAMNRQIVVDAIDADGNLGQQGHRLAYDFNGNRISDTWWGERITPPLPGGDTRSITPMATTASATYCTTGSSNTATTATPTPTRIATRAIPAMSSPTPPAAARCSIPAAVIAATTSMAA